MTRSRRIVAGVLASKAKPCRLRDYDGRLIWIASPFLAMTVESGAMQKRHVLVEERRRVQIDEKLAPDIVGERIAEEGGGDVGGEAWIVPT